MYVGMLAECVLVCVCVCVCVCEGHYLGVLQVNSGPASSSVLIVSNQLQIDQLIDIRSAGLCGVSWCVFTVIFKLFVFNYILL